MGKINISFIAGVEYHGKLYASAKEINGLFCLDLKTQELVFIRRFSMEKEVRGLYRNAFLYKNEAWFIPGRGRYIAIVNLDSLKIEYCEFPFRKKNKKVVSQMRGIGSSIYVSGGIIAHQFLYLIPLNIDAFVMVDMKKREFYPYYDVIEPDGNLLSGTYAKGNIYILPQKGNNLIEINLKTKKKRIYILPKLNMLDQYAGIGYYNNRLWIVHYEGACILRIDLNARNPQMIEFQDIYRKSYVYHNVLVVGNKLFLLPYLSDRILKLNMDNGQMTQLVLGDIWGIKEWGALWQMFVSKENIIFHFPKKQMLLYTDTVGKNFWKIRVNIEKSSLSEILYEEESKGDFEIYQVNGCYKEDILGIDEFVRIIIDNRKEKEKIYRSVGEDIWNMMKT